MSVMQYKLYLRKDTGRTYLRKSRVFDAGELEVFCRSPDKIYQLMEQYYKLSEEAEEYVYVICVNSKCRIIGIFELSHGTVSASIVSPRGIFQRALLIGATSIVLVHNHPSQDVTPSQDDVQVTHRIYECGKWMNLELLDHIIVGNGYYSFNESGTLK